MYFEEHLPTAASREWWFISKERTLVSKSQLKALKYKGFFKDFLVRIVSFKIEINKKITLV